MKYYFHHSCEISAHTASARRRYVRTKFVIIDPGDLENHPIAVSLFLIKLTPKMHEFRRNLDDAILHARRRTMSRWKALKFLQNISANQRDRITRRDTRRAQTRKLTFFIFFFSKSRVMNNETTNDATAARAGARARIGTRGRACRARCARRAGPDPRGGTTPFARRARRLERRTFDSTEA